MADKKRQQPQQAQEAQQAELEQLMRLSLSEIAELPEDKQNIVYAELARQAAEFEIPEGLAAGLEKLANMPTQTAEALQTLFSRFIDAQKEWQRKWEALQKSYDFGRMAEALQQLSEVGPTLQPYIDEIYNADPEKWANKKIPEVYAAAAQAARADGKEIPQLWFERDGEQLRMDLDATEEQQPEAIKKETTTPAELLETIKTVQAITAAAHVMPNNSLINKMQDSPTINAGEFDLVVANEQGRRKEITNITMVSYDPQGETGITITDPKLSEYERQVSDAVISLWEEARKNNIPPVVTVDMIYQSMPGGGERPSPAQRGAITRTMEKLRRLHIYMDATYEMQKRGKIDTKSTFVIDNYYFNFARGKYKAPNSRQTVNAYQLDGEPIMLTYSKMTGQLLTIQAKYLDIRKIKGGLISPELVNMSEGRQSMTGYMLRRIATIKHDEEMAKDALRQYEKRRKKEPGLDAKPLAAFRKQSRTILFDTIFENAGTTTTNRAQTKDNRDFCFEVLEYWRISGLIKEYSEQRKGKKITGFSVKV